MKTVFFCETCQTEKTNEDNLTTGYGIDHEGKKHCFECCGKNDAKEMETAQKITLYLSRDGDGWKVTNWPGTLKFRAGVSKGRHNIAGSRYDAWFIDHVGNKWHGVTYGEFTQICHCRRIKK